MTRASALDYAPIAAPLFDGVMLGGFECSCHRLADGRRLDLLASTRHDELAAGDYERLRAAGFSGARDGVPWVRVQRENGAYDFASVEPVVRAAERAALPVCWDLMHFGWPDDVDVFSSAFVRQFGRYANAFASWLADETDSSTMIAPINEISFLSWAGGDVRYLNPFCAGRGLELKKQLVRASIEAIEAVRSVIPQARFLQPEPLIHVLPEGDGVQAKAEAEAERVLQFQAWDMLAGRDSPELGGRPEYLDILGVNFYPYNQFVRGRGPIGRDDPRYRPFSQMLLEVSARYSRPVIVAETGTEDEGRVPWLRYVTDECIAALERGCQLHAVTLYPVVNHPGWGDDRHCHNGLWDYADAQGHRPVFEPLLEELRQQSERLHAARSLMLGGSVKPPSSQGATR